LLNSVTDKLQPHNTLWVLQGSGTHGQNYVGAKHP